MFHDDKLMKTQMAPIGATTHQKGNDQQQCPFSLLYVYPNRSLDIFMNTKKLVNNSSYGRS